MIFVFCTWPVTVRLDNHAKALITHNLLTSSGLGPWSVAKLFETDMIFHPVSVCNMSETEMQRWAAGRL